MEKERAATGWTTTGISTTVSATRPLTIADVDAYVQRGTATGDEAESLARALDQTLDGISTLATVIATNSALDTSLSGPSVSDLVRDLGNNRSDASMTEKTRYLIRSRASLLADALASPVGTVDLVIESAAEGILADPRRTAILLAGGGASGRAHARSLAVHLNHDRNGADRSYVLLFALVGMAIYGLIALGEIPLSVGQEGSDAGASGLAQPDADVEILTSVGVLMPASEEEQSRFEPVSSLIERAIDTGQLSPEVEHDLGVIGRMMADCRRMMTDTGDDLYEAAARKLDLLLPAVLDAIEPGSSQTTSAILKASEAGASTKSQVAAIDAAMAVVSDSISEAAQSLPTPVTQPFTLRIADALDRYSDRIEKELPAYERFQTNLERIAQLGPVRATIWGGKIVVGTTIGLAAQAVAISAEIPVPASTTHGAAVSAVLSSIVLKWMYARQRRKDPTLPGLPQSGDLGKTSDPSAGTPRTQP